MPEAASLASRLTLRFALGMVIMGAMLFLPAGTIRFWQGWVFMMILLVPGLVGTIYLYKRDPQVLERRMRTKEKVREQKLIMTLFYIILLPVFLLPGFDHRFGWSHSPLWLTVLSQALVFASYLMTFWVLMVNRFASRTIEVEPGQSVVSTGPYRIVRHPMYSAGIIIFLFTPLALGSYWTLPAFTLMVPLIVLRLLNEEKVLCRDLAGYSEYCRRTRFRLIPFIW